MEADYKRPLTVGDEVEIQIETERIGNTSFTLIYRVVNSAGDVAVKARTVNVVINKEKFTKIPIPGELRRGLEKINTGE